MKTPTHSTIEIPSVPNVTDGMVHYIWNQRGKKMGGIGKVSGNVTFSSAAHLFSPSRAQQSTPFRCERSERAESPT